MMSFATKRAPVRRRNKLMAIVASMLPLVAAGMADAGVTVVNGFEGGSQLINCALGECFRPPDTMGAVGTTQFMETANGYIRIYDKNTGAVQSSVSMRQFWTDAGQIGAANGDQRVLFDHYTNRWIAIGFGSSTNFINIGVSDTANAMGTWKSTQIVGASIGVPATTLDYPTLAVNGQGVVIGTNNFPFAGGFSGTSLLVIPKTSLFGGAPSLAGMTTFTTPCVGACATPDNGFAIQGAVNWFNGATTTMAVQSDSRDFNAQVFYKVNGVNAAGATQTPSAYIAGEVYVVAGAGRQPDGSRLVDTLSPRITGNVAQLNGKLYSAITVDDGTGHAAVRWSVVDAATGLLIDQGLISGGGYDYYEGSISVNEFGEAVIGYNRSGFQTADTNADGLADGNISFLAQAFLVDGGGGLDPYGSEMLLRVSPISDYHAGARSGCDPNVSNCRERWGDYSAVTFDPTNHYRFFAIGEYASDWATYPNGLERAVWSTYIAEIEVVPEPETYLLVLLGLAMATVTARRRRPTSGTA